MLVSIAISLILISIIIYSIYYLIIERKENAMSIEERHLRTHWKELKKRGYKVIALMLQGSQNYNLHEYSLDYCSDIDSKAIVVPTFRDFLNNVPPVSETVKFENGEQCDVKDIRVMFEQFRKQNLSYLELLYTKYRIVDWRYKKLLKPLWEERDAIAAINRLQLAKATAGTVMEKRKALCHPYPTLMEKIEKYGYDGKQLSHAVRLYYLMSNWEKGMPLEECFVPNEKQREELMNFKKQLDICGNPLDKEIAIEFCDEMVKRTGEIKNRIKPGINGKGIKVLDKVKYNVIRRAFRWK
jgi:hypothetical protein